MFRLLKDGETFVAFDTETTGLKADEDRIIEIGAVKFDKTGIISQFGKLINPQKSIPYQITKITGISNQMVQDKPVFSQILPDLLDFLQDSIIVGHNIQFDLRFLKAEMERLEKTAIKNQAIDTLQFSRWAYPDLKKYKQTDMAELLGVKIKEAHRAYDDAFVCGNVFLHLISATSDRQK